MIKTSYTDRQIEVANLLSSITKEDVSAEVIDEIINKVGEADRSTASSVVQDDTIEVIKLKLLDEKDWRKRAALSAMIISKSLE